MWWNKTAEALRDLADEVRQIKRTIGYAQDLVTASNRLEGVIRDNISLLRDLKDLRLVDLAAMKRLENEQWLSGMANQRWARKRDAAMEPWSGCRSCWHDPCECSVLPRGPA